MSGALEGVTVVDLTWSWAGPMSTRLLADLGADVLRIEGVIRPDWTRYLCYPGNEPGDEPWNRGGYFMDSNQGKKSIVLNLQSERARDLLRRLIDQADVLVESFSPRVKHSWGLDFETLSRRNPRLVMASLTAFGQSGPFANHIAFGPTMEAMSGITSLGGVDGGPPERVGVMYGDPISGTCTAAAVVTALYEARATGIGQYVDVAGTEAAMALVGEAYALAAETGAPPPRPIADEGALVSGCFPSADGEYVCFSCFDDAELHAVANAFETAPGADAIAAAIAGLPADEAMDRLSAAGVAASLIYDTRLMLQDEHLAARGSHWYPEHPAVGALLNTGSVFRSSDVVRPLAKCGPSPLYGEHTRDVLRERLGITDAEFEALVAENAVALAPQQAEVPPPPPIALWKAIGIMRP